MAIAYVQGVAGNCLTFPPTTWSGAFPSNVTAGNTIIVIASSGSSTTGITCSDNQGNTYTNISTPASGFYASGEYMFVFAAVAGSTGPCTVALNGGTSKLAFQFATEWSGFSSLPTLDTFSSHYTDSGAGPYPSTPITTTIPNEPIISIAYSTYTAATGNFSTTLTCSGNGTGVTPRIGPAVPGSYTAPSFGGGTGGGPGVVAIQIALKYPTSHHYTQTVTDVVTVASTLSRGTAKSLASDFSISDLFTKVKPIAFSLLDAVSPSELLTRFTSARRSEALVVGEAVSRSGRKTLGESFALADTFSKLKSRLLSLTDSFVIRNWFSFTSYKQVTMVSGQAFDGGTGKYTFSYSVEVDAGDMIVVFAIGSARVSCSDNNNNTYTQSGAILFATAYETTVANVTLTVQSGTLDVCFITSWKGISSLHDQNARQTPFQPSNTGLALTSSGTSKGSLVVAIFYDPASGGYTPYPDDGSDQGGTLRLTTSGKKAILMSRTQNKAERPGDYTIGYATSVNSAYNENLMATFNPILKQQGLLSFLHDAYSLSSSITRRATKRVKEALTMADAYSWLKVFVRPLFDSAVPSERFNRATNRTLLDAAAPQDRLTKDARKSNRDGLTLGDSISRRAHKACVDTLSWVENLTRSASHVLSDAVSVLDTIWINSNRKLLNLFEALNPLDFVSRALQIARKENFSLSDSTSKAATRNLLDAWSISDLVAWTKDTLVSLLDSINPTDSVKRHATRIYNSTVAVAESITKSVNRILSAENFRIVDILWSIRPTLLAFSELFLLSDSLRRRAGKALNDTSVFLDKLNRAATRHVIDTMAVADHVARTTRKLLSDVLSTVETFTAKGYNPSIAAVRKFIAQVFARLWKVEPQIRTWSATENMITEIFKTPDSEELFEVDWTDAIGPDTILSAAWNVPNGMTLGTTNITANTASAMLSGGTVGKKYIVECLVTLGSGQIKTQNLQITIAY